MELTTTVKLQLAADSMSWRLNIFTERVHIQLGSKVLDV